MLASSSSRLPFLWLHGAHAVTTFSQTDSPPLDHVVPRSRGGESVWENVVTACAPCNHKKGNRLLEEASMELLHLPKTPAPVLFIRLAAPKIPSGWQPYLASWGSATAAA